MKKLVFLTLFISLLSATNAFSQQSTSFSRAVEMGKDRANEIKTRSIEMEQMRREAHEDLARPVADKAKFPEIKEDFERIQIINTNSLQKPLPKESSDYKSIFKAVAEIKKRSLRLKSNLFPISTKENKDEQKSKKDSEKLLKQELKNLVAETDKFLRSFTSSAIFQNIKLVNLKDSEKAETDLERIIMLCSIIEAKIKITETHL